MTIPGNVPLILAQLGQAERIALELQAHPEVQRQALQQAAPDMLRRENTKVPIPEKGEGSSKVRDREADGRQNRGERDKRPAQHAAPEEPEPELGQDAAISWAGHIVNIKV